MKQTGKRRLDIGSGIEEGVTLLPEDPEDMWHANNLILVNDILQAHAVRKVIEESGLSASTRRVHTELTIRVTETFFDPATSSLKVNGSVVVENAYVGKGKYHTLDLELHRPFTLWKQYGWDSVAEAELAEALNDDKDGAVAAVVMDDTRANVCLITNFQTRLKKRVTGSTSSKSSLSTGPNELSKSTQRFYSDLLSALTTSIDFDSPRLLLLASPGFAAEYFKKYILDQAAKTNNAKLRRIGTEAVVLHATSGHVHSLNDALKSDAAEAVLKDKKFRTEAKLMDNFFARLRLDEHRVTYGVKPVERAVLEGAVGAGGGTLLVNNALFRSQDIETRKRYVALVDKVKADGGTVALFSSDHESGQRLDALGGIAALLTYPIMDEEDWDDDDDKDEADAVADEVGEMII